MSTKKIGLTAFGSALLMIAASDVTAEYSWLVVPAIALAVVVFSGLRKNAGRRLLIRDVGMYLGFLVVGLPVALLVVVMIAFAI